MMLRKTLVQAMLLAIIGAAAMEAGGPQLMRSAARRSDNDPVEQAPNMWTMDDPKRMPAEEDVGGSSMANAFLGEEHFLQDSDIVSSSQKKDIRRASLSEEAAGWDAPFDLEHDAEVALRQQEIRQTGGAQASSEDNSFSSEQPFLRKVSQDTAMPIRWADHPDMCFRGQPADASGLAPLMIWPCADNAKEIQMMWILPTAEKGNGQIKWAPDQSRCIYVHDGWEGNGNPIYLDDCADTAKQDAMNFTISTPVTSGYSMIAYTKDKTAPNAIHCLDVHDMVNTPGNHIELWDCSSGTMWQIY